MPACRRFKPYESPGKRRPRACSCVIAFGRCALHTQGHTANNPLLGEAMPINPVWIHPGPASELGIKDGDTVEVSANGYSAKTRAFVTEGVHPRRRS